MNKTPLLSIIIPTFNSSLTIYAAIDSVVKQDFINLEILVIDNLSTDNTIEVAQGFDDTRIRIFSEKDSGVYDAMNKGIELSTGDWLYFLGSDDKLFNERILNRLAKKLEATQSEFVYGSVQLLGDSPWGKNNSIYDGKFTREKLFEQNICHQSIFYSRKLFKRVGTFNLMYSVCADWDFNHRCFAAGKTEYVNEIIAYFSTGGKSTKQPSDKFIAEDSIINLKKYYKLGHGNPLFKTYAKVFMRNAEKTFIAGHIFSSIYFLAMSVRHSNNKIRFVKKYMMFVMKHVSRRGQESKV